MHAKQFTRGMRVGVPICLGYLAVSFTLGITAKNAGLSAFQATLTSFLVNPSSPPKGGTWRWPCSPW